MKINVLSGLFMCFCMAIPQLSAQEEAGRAAKIETTYINQLTELSKNKQIQAAFQSIVLQKKHNRDELIALTEIPAPPFKEDKRAARYLQILKEAGVDSVWIDKVGNVMALRKGKNGKRCVVLDAHTDTVFPEGTDVTVKIKGDTLYAPGVGDDTRGLVMVASVLRAMNAAKIKTESDILFVGTVGEEGLGDLRGVKHLFTPESPRIDSWISIDGSDMGRISNMGLGSYRYRVTFKGPGGHSWGAFGLANPQHALGSAIHHFSKAADKFTSYGARSSFNVGRIGGGTSVNSIAFESWMEVDMRSEFPENLTQLDSIFKASVHQALAEHNAMKRKGPNLTVDIVKIGDRPSGELADDVPLVQKALAAVTVFGVTPSVGRGSTNANIPISKGVPAVTIGWGGKSGNAHALNEWWLEEDSYKAIQSALLTLVAEAGLVKN